MRIRQLAVLVLAAPLLFGQVKESVTVEVIDVPVYVINGNAPVKDLKKENFDLFVNGKRQKIDYFDTIDFAEVENQPQVAATRDPRERRLFLILFDLAFTRMSAIDRARKAAIAVIDAAAPSDYFAVATFSPRDGANFVAPFTNDHAVARRAVATLSASSEKDPLSLAISAQERRIYTFAVGFADGERIGNPATQNIITWNADRDARSMQVKRVIENQILSFDEIGARLEQLEGYKHVIVLSEGFGPGLAYANSYQTDPGLLDAMNAMFSSFKRANAVIDSVDIGSPERDSFMSEALRLMAQETGGQFIMQATDIKQAMQRISNTSAYGYRLGFHRPANLPDGDNKIEVKVRNVPRGTTVSYRRGFSSIMGAQQPFDGLGLADIILNDIPQTGVTPPGLAFRNSSLDIAIPEDAVDGYVAEVLLYIFDANGAVVDFKQKRVPVAGVMRNKLELPAGTYVAKVLVRSGDLMGFSRQQFVVP